MENSELNVPEINYNKNESIGDVNSKKALGKTTIKEVSWNYSIPIFDTDFGTFKARLDYKSWADLKCICYFTLDNGRKLQLCCYQNKNRKYTAKNSDYEFAVEGNLGQVFDIIISKTNTGNTKFESGVPSNLSENKINQILKKIEKKEISHKNPKGKKFYDSITDIDILQQAFFDACQDGKLAMVKYFIEKRNIEIDSSDFNGGSSGLRLASSNGHIRIVKYLLTDKFLEKHADFYLSDNFTECPAFRIACKNNHLNIVRFFLNNNYTINDKIMYKVVKGAMLRQNDKLLNLLIIKYKIPYTKLIKGYIDKYDCVKLRDMFEKR